MLACSRCIRSTPTSRASSATWCSDERASAPSRRPRGRARSSRCSRSTGCCCARRSRHAPARHRRARCPGHPARAFPAWDDNPAQAAADAVAAYGLGILVPLATLWLGTSAIGDLVEDRLLVYLWLKPVARWQLPAAAVLATATVVVPLTALPLAVSALVAGAGDVAPADLPRRFVRRRSRTPASSSRRASGFAAPSGGGSPSFCCGRTSSHTPPRARRASR